LADRGRTQLARYRHALRRRRDPHDRLRGALAPDCREVASAIAAFRSRGQERFYPGVAHGEETAGFLHRAVEGWSDDLANDADRVLAGKVRILSRRVADLAELRAASAAPTSERYPWHDDAVNDYRWDPRRYYRQVPMEYDRADVKVPWELSRCHQLVTLGRAYRATGDERYAGEVVRTIEDWIEQNPAGYGINWATSMEVAIRAVNWLWACQLIAPSEQLSQGFVERLLASLLEHGTHIADNIEVYEGGITTNHTLADYAGLVHLGLCLPELRPAPEWTSAGVEGLERCMALHVHPDGGHFENSVPYHRLVLEMLLSSYVLADTNGRPFGASYRDSLERMVDFVLHYTRPDGRAPLIGDSDDSRFHVLARYFDWDAQDHRYLLALGGALFGREDLAAAGRQAPGATEEVAWLLGPEAAQFVSSAVSDGRPLQSRAFPRSGRYVMRTPDAYLLLCADQVGSGGLGNHKHNDILGFELAVRGEPVVVDRGSYLYQSDLSWRDRFRSTRSHSTVTVDGAEQNEMSGPFGMRTDARVDEEQWRSEGAFELFQGSHTGFERLPSPVRHRRTLLLERERFALVVVDVLTGSGEHEVESFLQLDPRGRAAEHPGGASVAERAGGALARANEVSDGAPDLKLHPAGAVVYDGERARLAIVPINVDRLTVDSGWHAPQYGARVAAPVIRLSTRVPAGRPFGYVIVDAAD
jgi:hypothetical protein